MSLTLLRFIQALPAFAPVNAAVATGDRLVEAFAKLQGQINVRPRHFTATVNVAATDTTVTFASLFGQGFATAPSVRLTALSTSGTHPTFAELVSVSATQCVIRAWRGKDTAIAAVMGGTATPFERVAATVHLSAAGNLQ